MLKNITRKCIKVLICIAGLFLFRVKKVGEKNIKEDESYILCGNHKSYWDPTLIVGFTKRKVCFMAKEELFKSTFLRWLANIFDIFPVKRGSQDIEAIKNSLKVLKNGDILGIFPEGTRNGLAKQQKVKNGAAYLAARTGAKVIPVGIQGTFKPFTKVILNYGEPLDFSEYKTNKPEKEVLEKISQEILDNIIRLTNEKV